MNESARGRNLCQVEPIGYAKTEIVDIEPQSGVQMFQVEPKMTEAPDLKRTRKNDALDVILCVRLRHSFLRSWI